MDTNIVVLLGANSGVRIEGENSRGPQAHGATMQVEQLRSQGVQRARHTGDLKCSWKMVA